MESDTEETLSPMLLEDSPPPDEKKKQVWHRRLQIPLGILIVGLVGGGIMCLLSFADSKDVERVKAGNISLGEFHERDRRDLLSSGGVVTANVGDGSEGVTNPTPCGAPAGVDCVRHTESLAQDPGEQDVCKGQCTKANQKCVDDAGIPKCVCLNGYLDGPLDDGNDCKCVYDWSQVASGRTLPRRGPLCQHCDIGYERKTWTNNGKKQWCEKETRACVPELQDPDYPNIDRLGNGYNLLIGNLLELPRYDPGFEKRHKPIFSPYSVQHDDTRSTCKINGYNFNGAKACETSLKTTTFTNSRQVVKEIQKNVKTANDVQEFSFTISEGEKAQSSNSVSFGESFTQTTDSTEGETAKHCVDESVSESTEKGQEVEYSRSTEEQLSFEVSQSESQNEERTDTKIEGTSKSQTTSSSHEHGSKTRTGSKGGYEVSASASFFGFFSGSTKLSAEFETSSETSENFINGKSSEYGVSRSEESLSSSSAGKFDERTNSNDTVSTNSSMVGNSTNTLTSKGITTNICKEGSSGLIIGNGTVQKRDETNDYNTASSFKKTFEIPGDARSVAHSTAVAKSDDFFRQYSGTIVHSTARCVIYEATLNDLIPPSFSKEFKDRIIQIDQKTEELWDTNMWTKKLQNGKLVSLKNERNERVYDGLFENFIHDFGTHFISSAEMGGLQRYNEQIQSFTEDEGNRRELENCFEEAIAQKKNLSTHGSSGDQCEDGALNSRVKSALEKVTLDVTTIGASAVRDNFEWTNQDIDSPALLPNFKLSPIVKVFQPIFMNRERISREDGTSINIKRILSWFMPRYAILLDRCKLMSNHHVHEGKSCRPNSFLKVATRDGNGETTLSSLCLSLPDHVLEPSATECTWCPGGVDIQKRRCKPN